MVLTIGILRLRFWISAAQLAWAARIDKVANAAGRRALAMDFRVIIVSIFLCFNALCGNPAMAGSGTSSSL